MSVAIQIENLSKLYRIGNVGTGTLSRDLQRWFITNVIKKEDPYLTIGAENDHKSKITSEFVYSLHNINLEIQQGSSLAIIGRNGAGKSTLLKIISRITSPSSGSVKIKGRIASLLEVGTGFHPDLSGRENIFINGSILGMRKHEIQKSLDEIIEFSGVENYIDTPVKRYSSGMYVRLAFSVAAHLNSEIMIVDEVLAVGDFEFQKKCLEKLKQIQGVEGRTILFVSHNITALKALCNNGILLENGKITTNGGIDNVISQYMGVELSKQSFIKLNNNQNGFIFYSIGVKNEDKEYPDPIERIKPLLLEIQYENLTGFSDLYFTIKFKDNQGVNFLMTHTNTIALRSTISHGKGIAVMKIPRNYLNDGIYTFDLWVQRNKEALVNIANLENPIEFQLLPEKRELSSWMGKETGYIRQVFDWQSK